MESSIRKFIHLTKVKNFCNECKSAIRKGGGSVMEWHWERYKVSAKYTARIIISVPAGNGQAGRAPD